MPSGGAFAAKEALTRFFNEIIDHSIGDRHRKGCFLVNSALEIAPHHAACRAVIVAQFREIEGFFKRCVLAAQAQRTVSLEIDAVDAARLLLGALLGIRVLARTVPERGVLEGVARPALALLHPPRPKSERKTMIEQSHTRHRRLRAQR